MLPLLNLVSMKPNLITYKHITMGTKKARDTIDSFKADYASLYQLLDAFVSDEEGRIARGFTPIEYRRWCKTVDVSVDELPENIATWFRDLMSHLSHHVRFQLNVMEKAKGSAITTISSLGMYSGEIENLSIPTFHATGHDPRVLVRESKMLSDYDRKRFLLTGDRDKTIDVVFHFQNNNVYMRNLVTAIVLAELHRNGGSPVRRHRCETNADWFARVEESQGIRVLKDKSDKPNKLPKRRTCH